jgi:hypothetical protein
MLAAMLVAAPAQAETWVDGECRRVLVSEGNRFLFQDAGVALTTCRIADWPISASTSEMRCDSGGSPTVKLNGDNTIVLDGNALNPYDGPLPCGASGAEWPD